MKDKKTSLYQICFIVPGVLLNIVGSNLALFLKIPIYFDTLGTVLCAILFGSIYGMITGLISSVLVGITTDIYSLFFIPVSMLIGYLSGAIYHNKYLSFCRKIVPLFALFVSIPSTIIASCISAFFFSGITNSGSSILVQILHHIGINLTASIFFVQFITDYIDRILVILCALFIMKLIYKSKLINKISQ